MKSIVINDQNCDYDDGIIPCYETEVYAVYFKNNKWHAYGGFNIKSQKDVDELLDEVSSEANVSIANIKMVKPISIEFKEVNLSQITNKILNKKRKAAKLQIEKLKKQYQL